MPVFQMDSGSEVTPGEITEAPLNRMKPEPKGNDNLCQVQSCTKVQCPTSNVQSPGSKVKIDPRTLDIGRWTLDIALWTVLLIIHHLAPKVSDCDMRFLD